MRKKQIRRQLPSNPSKSYHSFFWIEYKKLYINYSLRRAKLSNKQIDLLAKTIAQAIEGMELSFDPAQAKDMAATIQFHVTGDDSGEWVLKIENGRCQCHTVPGGYAHEVRR
jgi:hypothetical protein